MGRRIPVLVVAGFLGAGKTTVLNHLLRRREARIGVVVNDFGAVNIDAMLVAGQVDAMVSLGNGCVCCAVDVTELDDLFARLAEPRQGIDVIVVEASGLAEPRNLIRMVLGSDNPRLRYGGLIEVVDAEHFEDSRVDHPELAAHLRLADLIVLNKADRVPGDRVGALRTEIETLAGPAPVYATAHGVVEPALLFDLPERADPRVARQLSFDELLADDEHDHHDHETPGHRHLHDDYDSVTFTSTTAVDPRRLVAFFEDPPPGLFRAKGTVVFAVPGQDRAFLLQLVGRHVVFEPVARPRSDVHDTRIVLIGSGLDADSVRAGLHATEHTGTELLDQQSLLPVWRYVPREITDRSA